MDTKKLYATKRHNGQLVEVYNVDRSRCYICRTEASGRQIKWYADRSAAEWVKLQRSPGSYVLVEDKSKEGQSNEG